MPTDDEDERVSGPWGPSSVGGTGRSWWPGRSWWSRDSSLSDEERLGATSVPHWNLVIYDPTKTCREACYHGNEFVS